MTAGQDPSRGAVSNHRRRRLDVRVIPHRRRSALRLRDWRMRSKLGTVLIVPSVAFLVLAGVQTGALVNQANVLDEFAQEVGVGRQITALVHELQQERDRTAGDLAGLQAAPSRRANPDETAADLQPFYTSSDNAVTRFHEAAAPLLEGDASWQVSYSQAETALGLLPDVRAAVPAGVLSAETVLGNYNRAIDALLTLLAEPSPGVERPELTEAVLRYVQLARLKEVGSRIRAQLYSAARAGRYGTDDQVILSDLWGQQLGAVGEFRVAATAAQIQQYAEIAALPGFKAATQMEEKALASAGAPAVLEPRAWWDASLQRHTLLRQVEVMVLGDAVEQAEARSAAQLRQTLLVAGGVLAVLLFALLISVVIGRSIAESLRTLRTQAMRVAQLELPEALERLRTVKSGLSDIEVPPADLRSMDEIGEVAEAFVAVHRSAITVAVEQAIMRRNVSAMFVNLARRSQVLVERQLELLDELEREESDPDQLDNLFKLDHLAARMRRNDDSLLVLAGSESSRRWSQPVMLSAVMLAATAEIEQYQRVRHQLLDQLYIVGHAVADLVHLLAELLENAASFSPPETLVHISGRVHGRDQAIIEIIDEGLGMSPTALVEANALLAAPPATDVAASERMGLFVVSNLAARQGVRVQLRAAERGLVTAVWLPAAAIAPEPEQGLEHPQSRRVLAALAATRAAATNGELASSSPTGRVELPIVGRRPGRQTVPRQTRRAVPTRAEDILTQATEAAARRSVWWPEQGVAPPVPTQREPVAAMPPPVSITAINSGGLPVRVPMAHLPVVTESATPGDPPVRDEPDPAAMGGMLARFYGGVRRAEAEDTTEISIPPAGGRIEEEHHE